MASLGAIHRALLNGSRTAMNFISAWIDQVGDRVADKVAEEVADAVAQVCRQCKRGR